MSCKRHAELREVLRKTAQDPRKIDKMTDEQLEHVAWSLIQTGVQASLKVAALSQDFSKKIGEITRTFSVPGLD